MAMTNEQLEAELNALKLRVNAIDGQGLQDPAQSYLNQLSRKYEGLKSDLRQSVMKLEQILNGLKKTVDGYASTMKQHLGL